jgi:hypothetical protein
MVKHNYLNQLINMSRMMFPGRSFLPLDLIGKMRESHGMLQGNTGKIWNIEAVFPP